MRIKIKKFEINIIKYVHKPASMCLYRNTILQQPLQMHIGNSLFWSQSIVSHFLPGVRDTSASHKDTDCYTG